MSSFILTDRQYLAVILRETVAKDTYIVLWDVVANKWESIELSGPIEGAINAVAMSSHGFLTPVRLAKLLRLYQHQKTKELIFTLV